MGPKYLRLEETDRYTVPLELEASLESELAGIWTYHKLGDGGVEARFLRQCLIPVGERR